MNPVPKSPGSSNGENNWSVAIEEQGRYGSITYREPSGTIPFYWEFGGNDVVVIISFENETYWNERHPWTKGRRAEILQRVADEVIRRRAPDCRAEIDERGCWINIRQGSPTPPLLSPPTPLPPSPHQIFRERKAKLMTILTIIVLVMAAAAVAFKTMFSIKSPTGSPLGLSVRTPEHIASLIQTLEPYVPTLHRNPDNDRYSLSLFLCPQDGRSPGKMISITKHRRAQEFTLAKILGCDGSAVWFNFNGVGGVNLKSGKLIGETELRRANPSLDESWDDQRRMEFDQRLRVTSADRQRIYEVIPETLQAVPAQVNRKAASFDPRVEEFLSSGARPSPVDWLGVHSKNEAAREYQPKSWLSRLNRATDAKEMRSLYRAQLGPELDRGSREILSLEPISDDEYFNAAFVRTGSETDPLRLSGPDSFLMIYTSKPGLNGTLMLARVDSAGKILWQTNTGIDRFKLSQILPNDRFIAFTGTRPPIPDKVSEPILVIVDNQSGTTSAVSLWQ